MSDDRDPADDRNGDAEGVDGADEADGADGGDADEETGPIVGGGERVREAAPDSAEEAAHSVLAVERAVLIASVVITAALLIFLAYSAATTPETAPPSVEVAGATATDNGTDLVRVALTNHGGTGIETATVGVDCGSVSTEVEFENVPATNTATGVVVCPTGAERNLTIRSWQVA